MLCVPIDRNVKVKDGKPVELGRLLQDRPPVVCESTGAWRRVSELCAAKGQAGGQAGEPGAQQAAPGRKQG